MSDRAATMDASPALDVSHPARHSLELLTAQEAAALLKVDDSTVYRLMSTRQLPTVKFGRSVRITASDLQNFIAAHRSIP